MIKLGDIIKLVMWVVYLKEKDEKNQIRFDQLEKRINALEGGERANN